MAKIDYPNLVDWLKRHPRYQEFEFDVDAGTALYISFSTPEARPVNSETLELADGHLLVLDREKNGAIVGLEIV